MTLEQIKEAVLAGKTVHWATKGYTVQHHPIGGFNIICTSNDNCCGLTHRDGVTMNGDEDQFFIA